MPMLSFRASELEKAAFKKKAGDTPLSEWIRDTLIREATGGDLKVTPAHKAGPVSAIFDKKGS